MIIADPVVSTCVANALWRCHVEFRDTLVSQSLQSDGTSSQPFDTEKCVLYSMTDKNAAVWVLARVGLPQYICQCLMFT